MTQSMTITLTCPTCGNESETEIWTSINGADNPDEAQWLIDGFLFEHKCPACGTIATLNHDCLYHDPARKVMIQYATTEEKRIEASAALAPYRDRGYRIRIVPTRYALREKAALLRDGLDDRAVELVKFLVYNKFVGERRIDATRCAYYGALDEDGGIIVEFVGDAEPLETVVPRDVYDGALDQIEAANLEDPEPAAVDRAWAATLYETLG